MGGGLRTLPGRHRAGVEADALRKGKGKIPLLRKEISAVTQPDFRTDAAKFP